MRHIAPTSKELTQSVQQDLAVTVQMGMHIQLHTASRCGPSGTNTAELLCFHRQSVKCLAMPTRKSIPLLGLQDRQVCAGLFLLVRLQWRKAMAHGKCIAATRFHLTELHNFSHKLAVLWVT